MNQGFATYDLRRIMVYFAGWFLSFLLARFYIGVRVFGSHNIPRKGAFILASNHLSNADPFILGTSFLRPLDYMAKEEIFRSRFGGWLFRKFRAHPVKRGASDYRALKEALKILSEGNGLLIFPEGTRSRDGVPRRARPGIGFIALKSGVPVVPAYIEGSCRAVPEGLRSIRRHPVKVYIGRPINGLSAVNPGRDEDVYQKVSDDIMERIVGLKALYEDKAC